MSIKSFMENVFSDNSVVDNCNVNPDVPSVFGADKPTVLELLGKLMRWKVGSVNGVQPDEDGNVNVEVGTVKPLTFTGAVTATFDGTRPVTVNIPQGGGAVNSVNEMTGDVHLGASDVGAVSEDAYERDKEQFTQTLQQLNADKYGVTNPPPYPVRSVNGKTGAVTLSATDVGAPTTAQHQNLVGEVNGMSIDLVGKYSPSNPPPYPVTTVNGYTDDVILSAMDVGAIKVGGNAVVFGDSYFDGGTVYNFASYLRGLGIYSDVTDYAKGGTGFGNTGVSGTSGYSITELLAKSAVRAAVQQADVIYIHAGGNDLMGGLYIHNTETVDGLYATVKSCFDTLYTLNNNATVIYAAPITPNAITPYAFDRIRSFIGSSDISNFMNGSIAIEAAVCMSKCNAVFVEYSNYIKTYIADNLHPDVYSAHCLFRNIVYGSKVPTTVTRMLYLKLDDNLVPTTESVTNAITFYNNKLIGSPMFVIEAQGSIITSSSSACHGFIYASTTVSGMPFDVILRPGGLFFTAYPSLYDPTTWNFTAEQQSTAQQKLGILSSEGVKF